MRSLSPLPALKYHAQVPSAASVFFLFFMSYRTYSDPTTEHILILQQNTF